MNQMLDGSPSTCRRSSVPIRNCCLFQLTAPPIRYKHFHNPFGGTAMTRMLRLMFLALLITPLFFVHSTVAQQTAKDQSSSVTFTKDVLPILQKNCQSCHRPGQVAPMSLISYNDARPWAKAIKTAVTLKQMPPWFADAGHFTNARSLTQHEIATLVKWADTGALEGDTK